MVDEFAAAIHEERPPRHRRRGRACGCWRSSRPSAPAWSPAEPASRRRPELRGAGPMTTDVRSRGATRPGHRRRRHDRLDHRRPAARRRRRPRSACSTTWSAAGGPTSRGAARRSAASSWSRATSATVDLVHDLTAGSDLVFHQAAIRITQCAEEPRLALEVLVDGTFNVLEAAAAARGRQGRRRLVGLGLRAGRGVPDHRAAPPVQQRHLLRRGEGLQRGHAAQLPRHVRADYVALRYFNVYGPRMDIHGLYTEVLIRWMERIADGPAAADLRRRPADDGLRLHRPTSPGPTCSPPSSDVTEGVYNVASGAETSLLGAGRGAARGRWTPTSASSTARSARSTA